MTEMTYLQAISAALRDELRADERVLVMGEDIGVFGGAFKVTDGFIEEFGADRVMDTPLAESAIIGVRDRRGRRRACGRSARCSSPTSSRAASTSSSTSPARCTTAWAWRSRSSCGCPSGGGFSGGPFHSQNPEAWFMHAPGLKVVAPSTAEDAKGLLHAAIRDPNPVCFMEHKHLYRRVEGEVPDGMYETPFTARVARAGIAT